MSQSISYISFTISVVIISFGFPLALNTPFLIRYISLQNCAANAKSCNAATTQISKLFTSDKISI